MKKKIEKQCISCGEKGHTYLECQKIPFVGLFAGALGINPELYCGMNAQELKQSIEEHAVWNKNETSS